MTENSRISIWFFIGAMLLIYGILIFSSGVINYFSPSPESQVVLSHLHPAIWWGFLMTILGIVYLVLFRPGRKK